MCIYPSCDLLETFYQRSLSLFKIIACLALECLHQRLSPVAISAVLAKASRFLRASSNGQNRGLKTKRNWTNQYRPQWGMKQLPGLGKKSCRWGDTHTHTHTQQKPSFYCFFSAINQHLWSCTERWKHTMCSRLAMGCVPTLPISVVMNIYCINKNTTFFLNLMTKAHEAKTFLVKWFYFTSRAGKWL